FWPDAVTLRNLLRLFSTEVTEDDWSQPDVLGWVYQYYNTEANSELKRRKNRTIGFKYKPDDIPIANQFYTPHWVVRVLTDNTLGRLWLEMHERLPQLESYEEEQEGKRQPRYRLSEHRCDVPHAAVAPEAFKTWISEEADVLRDHTVDRLCRFLVPLPSQPVPRGKKNVREIRVLDPACGSGHFLLYAFDILFAIYREAEPDLDPREIPALILENNLFGIDIDLRAAQLAVFELYLKARATLAAIDPSAPLRLRRLNIVVADAHIGNDPRKEAFLERYQGETEIQELYRKILADLDHTNVLGSLLKVRTEFERLFGRVSQVAHERSRKQQEVWAHAGQQELFSLSPQRELSESFSTLSGRTWTVDELLDDLRRFEEEVLPSQDIGARLFYTDLERTVGLLSLLSQQYDVVLMNPPYGDMPPEARDYLQGNKKKKIPAHYPRTHQDYATAFLEQALDLLHPNGFVGGLIPRSFMYLSSYEKVRTEILAEEARSELLQEYGLGILDGATVRTVGAVVRKGNTGASGLDHPATFHRLAYYPTLLKPTRFIETLPLFASVGPDLDSDWFVARLRSLFEVPSAAYAYPLSDGLRELFQKLPPIDHGNAYSVERRPHNTVAEVRSGMHTCDDSQFTRWWWECTPKVIGRGRRWVPYVKGGKDLYFYARNDVVLNWENDGEAVKAFTVRIFNGGHWSRVIINTQYFYHPGFVWQKINSTGRCFAELENDHIISHTSLNAFPKPPYTAAVLVSCLNSSLVTVLKFSMMPERKWEVGLVASLPVPKEYKADIVQRLECFHLRLKSLSLLHHLGDETCRDFVAPDLVRLFIKQCEIDTTTTLNIASLLLSWLTERKVMAEEEARLLRELDEEVSRLYEVSPEDRALIERELARRPKSESGYSAAELASTNGEIAASDIDDLSDVDQTEDDADAERAGDEAEAADEVPDEVTSDRARDLVSRFVSYYLKQTLEADPDGIVPVAPTHGEPGLIIRLRETMNRDLGETAVQALEAQVPVYLGTEDLAEWLAVSKEETREVNSKKQKFPLGFFPWHVTLYRNRPIFWLLSSESFEKGKTRFTFRAFIHYLKLTPDTLPRLMGYYLDPALDWANGEWQRARNEATRLEGRAQKAANTTAQEWLNTVDALKRFRAALESVIQEPPRAERVPENAKWLPWTIAQVRGGQDLGHGYQPDIDYGVRVNITPLVEAKLLPKLVLKRLGG
ncbi:MAG: hypothetical protein HYZ72_15645, partial [Deltaproteobacteria bacterium]|nr:hypothetical protein [Deltaproteobacteria bacterium]